MKKEILSRKYVYLNILPVIVYVCMYMSPSYIVDYVNDPYTNEWLLLLFGNHENFSLKPLLNIEFSTLNVFIFLCIDLLLLTIYTYTSHEK